MRKRLFLPIFFISFAAVLLLFSRENAALAAMPEDGPEKGTIAAASTAIDRSTYTDGSVFENEPAKVETVKIGLRYGEDGVYSAWLVNPYGEGFLVGFYDEDRRFQQLFLYGGADLSVSGGQSWHILLDGAFSDFAQARNSAL